MNKIHLFYEEPDPDRWVPYDRYIRNVIRKIIRGTPEIAGMRRVVINLCLGLDKLNVSYDINNYKTIRKNKDEVACVIGKNQVLDKLKLPNSILYGPAIWSHPIDDECLKANKNVKKILVSCEWHKRMYESMYPNIGLWAAGIDTEVWSQKASVDKREIDVLLYDKVRWEYGKYEQELINPIKEILKSKNCRVEYVKYGFYKEGIFRELLAKSKSMVFLCEHETQGLAYQQALSSGVPLLAWDRGGYWSDPEYFPDRVKFEPVTSVPYWDERCGLKFKDFAEFSQKIDTFLEMVSKSEFAPRDYILENLTLEKCARRYLDILKTIDK